MDVASQPDMPLRGAPGAARPTAALLAAAALLLMAGCQREEVTSYRVAKEAPAAAPGAGDGAGGLAPARRAASGHGG